MLLFHRDSTDDFLAMLLTTSKKRQRRECIASNKAWHMIRRISEPTFICIVVRALKM